MNQQRRKKLLIATRNPGKLEEYRELFAALPLELTTLDREEIELEVEESGESFEENAVLKARTYARLSGLPTLADDSGLEVMALHGEPGVRSARYAGPGASDVDRYRLLLERLKDVPWEKRQARFRCVIAIATPEGALHTVQGQVTGYIAFEPRGQHGFGYDPVFYLPRFGKTMAELPPEVKNRISHRADAARKALPILRHVLDLDG